ncbi:MFS transporter [Streptomyces sp. SID5770]|uniref:MFS transporter n=1 Tax=Streptomyces sp. SID5770 TaxID=2690308 RepID=UPI00136ABC4A|nr:MFS transporter [Streptomyces sp. SID5770]MZE50187.1 MFS transporter [Streptomyces sp. SID5770]
MKSSRLDKFVKSPFRALGGLMPERGEARKLLAGTFFSALGHGLTLPFIYIYLTEVREIAGTFVGLAIGWLGLLSLFVTLICGPLMDKLGPRRIVLPALVLEAVGVGSLALVGNLWQAVASLTIYGLGGIAVIKAGKATILASLTSSGERQKAFGLLFALFNLGFGVGSAIAGSTVDISRPGSFQILYIVDMLCYSVPFVILVQMPAVGQQSPVIGKSGNGHSGYARLLRHRPFRRLIFFMLVLNFSGYAQLEVGFTGFAAGTAGASTAVIGYAFTANTIVIVALQAFSIRKLQKCHRTHALALASSVFAASWITLSVAGHAGIGATVAAFAVVGFGIIFAVGEIILSPVIPALVNTLAPDNMRGRYNAVSSMTGSASSIIAPVITAPLLDGGFSDLWVFIVTAGCLISALLAFSLRRHLSPEQEGMA